MQQSIFLAPANEETQTVRITRAELCGNHVLPERNAADTWDLSLNKLRAVAAPRIRVIDIRLLN